MAKPTIDGFSMSTPPQANIPTTIVEPEVYWDNEYLLSGQWKLVLGEILSFAENPEFALVLHRTIQQQLLAVGHSLPEEFRNWDKMSVAQRLVFLRVNLHMLSGLIVLVGKQLESMTQ